MTLIDTIKKTQDYGTDESIQKPDLKSLSDIDARVKEVLKEDIHLARPDKIQETFIPQIKGLEFLKDGGYAVDLEKTINDMFMVIKKMETQLEKVLTINALLEKDLRDSKEVIADLMAEKSTLESAIARMHEEMPSKRELQMELEHMLDERNDAQKIIRDLKLKSQKMQEFVIRSQEKSGSLEEEKSDVITEINFLESRLNAAVEKIGAYERDLNILKGEKLANVEKIKALEDELNATLDDKYRLTGELQKSQRAMAELHAAITDTKLHAKKSFYKGSHETKDGA